MEPVDQAEGTLKANGVEEKTNKFEMEFSVASLKVASLGLVEIDAGVTNGGQVAATVYPECS